MFADPQGKSLGHLALHYRTPDDGPWAAKLLELLGFKRMQEIVFGGGMVFYQFSVAEDPTGRGVGTLYLSMVPEPIAALTQANQQRFEGWHARAAPGSGRIPIGWITPFLTTWKTCSSKALRDPAQAHIQICVLEIKIKYV
jgi:hypothetical protein